MEKKPEGAPAEGSPEGQTPTLGDEILEMLGERCKNPGEAFVLLQQLSIFVWDQYKVDWTNAADHQASASRKQRFMDYIVSMIESLEARHALVNSDQ